MFHLLIGLWEFVFYNMFIIWHRIFVSLDFFLYLFTIIWEWHRMFTNNLIIIITIIHWILFFLLLLLLPLWLNSTTHHLTVKRRDLFTVSAFPNELELHMGRGSYYRLLHLALLFKEVVEGKFLSEEVWEDLADVVDWQLDFLNWLNWFFFVGNNEFSAILLLWRLYRPRSNRWSGVHSSAFDVRVLALFYILDHIFKFARCVCVFLICAVRFLLP